MKITTEDLQKLLGEVTPGHWMVDYPNNCDVVCDGLEIATTHPDVLSGLKPSGVVPQHNATLIAISPAIAREVIALRAAAEKLAEALRSIQLLSDCHSSRVVAKSAIAAYEAQQ